MKKKNEPEVKEELSEKEVKKAERKKKRKRIITKILLSILGLIVGFILVTIAITLIGNKANTDKAHSFEKVVYENQLVPELDVNGNYTFTTDKELKVLQITDVHIGAGWLSLKKDSMALNTVAALVTAEKPDLVVVTGDIGYPVPFQAGTFNNKNSAKMFAELMDTLGVYWTLGFGNHDTEAYSFYSREKISNFYLSEDYKYCIYLAGPDDVDGYGNQIVNVKRSDGIITQSLYILDSHSYTDGDIFGALWKYDNLHQNQVNWYIKNVNAYNELNSKTAESLGLDGNYDIKSAMFFHIPLTEYKDAWTEYAENGFSDTENVKYIYGKAGEGKKVVYCGVKDDNMFETIQELGSTQAVFCGHDHLNNFSIEYKGVRLTYGMSIDYLAYVGIYKIGSQRGCTVITFSPDGSFDCKQETYYQDKYTSQYEKEDVTMQEITQIVPAAE